MSRDSPSNYAINLHTHINDSVCVVRTKMETDAKAYDEVSGPQIEAGSRFIRDLNLSPGDKVLDMGCGTGHLTKYIADIVGPNGLAVGVDPDVERIQIAEKKSKKVSNLKFYVGSSTIGFPHDNEPYYDAHISTHTFHWVAHEEKSIYIQKAYQCLKSGGRLAIWCSAAKKSDGDAANYSLGQDDYRDLFQKTGLFTNVLVEQRIFPFRFKSFEEFRRWFKASTHKNLDDHPKFIEKFVTTEDDGQVACIIPHVSITACKS